MVWAKKLQCNQGQTQQRICHRLMGESILERPGSTCLGERKYLWSAVQAAMRADALLDAGDLEGQRDWLRVIEAIKVLANVERPSKAKIH